MNLVPASWRLLLFCILGATCASAREIPVSSPDRIATAVRTARPGDVVQLPAGEWRDAKLIFEAMGTAKAPITLKGAPQGGTVLTGGSQLRIGGDYLVVDGVHFRDPDPAAGEIIEFRSGSKKSAHHCRLTNCAVILAPGASGQEASESHWVNLYGADNHIDHCAVAGKNNGGTTLVVWLGPGQEGAHHIDHNYFGMREKLGRNGGETIRVGTSETSMQSAHCVIENNLFEHCDGELECISNKSCDNIYRENTFLAVGGTLTLRHGNRCIVERNVFMGQKAKSAGGIRIIGEDHIVRDNYLEALTGNDARSGISLMMGVPDSKPNEYFQVKRAWIENNTLLNCSSSILIGINDHPSATLPPEGVVFTGNRISAGKKTVAEARCPLAGVKWSGNVFFGAALGIPPTDGITWQEPEFPKPTPMNRADVGPDWLHQ